MKYCPPSPYTMMPRRSPRFLSSNSPEVFDPKTPKGNLEGNRILHSASTPLSSTFKSKVLNPDSINLVTDQVSRKSKINPAELKRSARLSETENQQEPVPNGITCQGGGVSLGVGNKVDACSIISGKTGVERTLGKSNLGIEDVNLSKKLKRKVSSASAKDNLGLHLSKEVKGDNEKRITCSDSRRNEREQVNSNFNALLLGDTELASTENYDRREFINKNTQRDVKLGVEIFSREEKDKYVHRGKEHLGKKRKLKQCKNKSDVDKGWSEEQEHALQRAYFAANPTPQFWKRVSKMVPGKSAQDCFDKIHSAHLTPPQAQRPSRAKQITPSSLSFSASKLLNSPELKCKRTRCSRLAQKTVRQLVQKRCTNGQDEGADLFAIFEATTDPSSGASPQPASCCTPKEHKGGSKFQNRCHETSTADRKSLSRLNTSSGSSLISPPVLKQIKNKALHEKYIDQLHRRETKRKAALSRAAKQVATRDGKVDAFNTARNSLYFDASEAINQFQQSQMNSVYNCDLSDDDHLENSYDGED